MIIDLTNKKGLVTGIANEHSIAYGCAEQFREAKAELATTFLNAKAEPFMRPLALKLKSPLILLLWVDDYQGALRCLLLKKPF